MRNAWLDEAQAGIKIAGRHINNLKYADNTTLMAEKTSLVAQTVKRLPTRWETQVQSLGWEDLLEKEWQPTPVFCPGESMDYIVHGVAELDMTERLSLSLVEKYYQAKTKHNDQS